LHRNSKRNVEAQGSATHVWRAESVDAQDTLDEPTTSTNETGTMEFVNHYPANFFNLLEVLRKYRYKVDSLIKPISSHEVVEQNLKAYKNCEISFYSFVSSLKI
jgi:hypothetical protein